MIQFDKAKFIIDLMLCVAACHAVSQSSKVRAETAGTITGTSDREPARNGHSTLPSTPLQHLRSASDRSNSLSDSLIGQPGMFQAGANTMPKGVVFVFFSDPLEVCTLPPTPTQHLRSTTDRSQPPAAMHKGGSHLCAAPQQHY